MVSSVCKSLIRSMRPKMRSIHQSHGIWWIQQHFFRFLYIYIGLTILPLLNFLVRWILLQKIKFCFKIKWWLLILFFLSVCVWLVFPLSNSCNSCTLFLNLHHRNLKQLHLTCHFDLYWLNLLLQFQLYKVQWKYQCLFHFYNDANNLAHCFSFRISCLLSTIRFTFSLKKQYRKRCYLYRL